jgi:type IV secretory pathway VirB10-like protein
MSTRVGLALIVAACIAAAGAGGYLATRQANEPAVAATTAAATAEPAGAPVHETEAVLDEVKTEAPAPAAPVQGSPAAPVERRVEPKAPPATPTVPVRRAPTARESRAPVAAAPAQPEPARRASADTPPERPAQASIPSEPSPAPIAEPAEQLPFPEVARRDEPVEPSRPAEPRFEELVVAGDSVIGLRIESSLSSETARVEDRVEARVTRDVTVHGRVAVPAGARVDGSVTLVDRGGKMRDRARLGVRFHTLVLADGTTLPIQTETVFREGDSPAASSSAKIGGAAIGGALLGAILGGGRGAVIGGTTGAAGGTAAVMAGGRKPATLSAGSTVTVRVLSPVSVTVERE